jgi:hypothetical protein
MDNPTRGQMLLKNIPANRLADKLITDVTRQG